REKELRVLQAERTGDARPHELVERHPRRALGDAAEDVGVVAVDPRLARLGDEWQGGKALHRRADRLVLVGGVPAEAGRWAEPLLLVQRRDRGIGAVGNP